MEYIDRLNELLQSKKMTAKELAERLNLGRTTINDWRRGKSTPSPSSLIGISHIFNTSIDWLLTGEGLMSKEIQKIYEISHEEQLKKMLSLEERMLLSNYRDMADEKKIDLQRRATLMATVKPKQKLVKSKNTVIMRIYDSPASAGYGNYLYEDESFEMITFDEDTVPIGSDFGVRISGDSMEPIINDGSIAWVKYQPKVEDGDIGIFVVEGESFCKKLKIDYKANMIYLISFNKKYEPKLLSEHDEIRTVGKVLIGKYFF